MVPTAAAGDSRRVAFRGIPDGVSSGASQPGSSGTSSEIGAGGSTTTSVISVSSLEMEQGAINQIAEWMARSVSGVRPAAPSAAPSAAAVPP
jgi:hypothetical protein